MHPCAVVCITRQQQLPLIIKFASEHKLYITVKGGGSNTGGAGITNDVLVDVTKLNTISPPVSISELEGNFHAPLNATHVVAVGAGATIYDVNRYLAQYSLQFPIVPTSHRVAQIGGAIATNAGAPESLRYGTIQPWIAAVDFCDGKALTHLYIDDVLYASDASNTSYPVLSETANSVKAIIRSGHTVGLRVKLSRYFRYKQVPGYNLPALSRSLNLPHIAVCNACLTGSMGTLGIISRALLYCIPIPQTQYMMVLEFDTLLIALKNVHKLRTIVDRFQQIVSCELLPISKLSERAQLLLEINYYSHHTDVHILREAIWRVVRNVANIGCFAKGSDIGARLMRRRKTAALPTDRLNPRALPIINDISIPIQRLSRVLPALMAFLVEKKVRFTMYGHILQGNVHFRPHMKFSTIGEKYTALRLARQFYHMVGRFGGIVGGEHGTGILRAPYVPRLWGKAGYTTMQHLSYYFNPYNILDSSAMFNTIFADQLPASLYNSHL